jgi:ATPase subunit of ABC transporter with duplicated ATPase domains
MENNRREDKRMADFKGTMLFASHGNQVTQTVTSRVIEIWPGMLIDRRCTLYEYLGNSETDRLRKEYAGSSEV